MIETKPYLLKNKIQNYKWGTKGKDAFIPRLLNMEFIEDKSYAELWIGAHPKASSSILLNNGEISLNKIIQQYPVEILGERSASVFNNKLPFLLKILSAAEALSIQAHPNKQQAVKLYKKDPVNYPDENHKPEIAVALDELVAVAGFKSISEIIETLTKYQDISEFIGKDFVDDLNNKFYKNILTSPNIYVKEIFSSLMLKSLTNKKELSNTIEKLYEKIKFKLSSLEEVDKYFLELKNKYGNDAGLLTLFLLNFVHLKKGDAIFIEAGTPHAYLKGNIVECMASSDNVVRSGLTGKHKDVETLLDILTYKTGLPKIFRNDLNSSEIIYDTPSAEFKVTRHFLTQNDERELTNYDSPLVLLVADGKIKVKWKDGQMFLEKGDSAIVPASLTEIKINFESNSELYSIIIP